MPNIKFGRRFSRFSKGHQQNLGAQEKRDDDIEILEFVKVGEKVNIKEILVNVKEDIRKTKSVKRSSISGAHYGLWKVIIEIDETWKVCEILINACTTKKHYLQRWENALSKNL